MKFKVGDKVKLKKNKERMSAKTKDIAIIVGFNNSYHSEMLRLKWITDTSQCNGSYYADDFELVKEEKLKDTISLRELIEQGACHEGILWYLDNEGDIRMLVKKLIEEMKADNKTEWIAWLYNHGYNVENKEEIKNEINELKERLKQLEKKL